MLNSHYWYPAACFADFVDSLVSAFQDAQLCYLRSRMCVQDEIKDYGKYESLSFTDFLEALGRAADLKALPSRDDLETNGFSDVFQWHQARDASTETAIAEINDCRDKFLSDKLDVFLHLVFRQLHYDPSQPESEFSHESLLKLVKKKDRDLGP